jgi:hypothetical protein
MLGTLRVVARYRQVGGGRSELGLQPVDEPKSLQPRHHAQSRTRVNDINIDGHNSFIAVVTDPRLIAAAPVPARVRLRWAAAWSPR